MTAPTDKPVYLTEGPVDAMALRMSMPEAQVVDAADLESRVRASRNMEPGTPLEPYGDWPDAPLPDDGAVPLDSYTIPPEAWVIGAMFLIAIGVAALAIAR
jgi:hypothetical protein